MAKFELLAIIEVLNHILSVSWSIINLLELTI